MEFPAARNPRRRAVGLAFGNKGSDALEGMFALQELGVEAVLDRDEFDRVRQALEDRRVVVALGAEDNR